MFNFNVKTNLSIANHVWRVFTCFLELVAGKIVPQCFIHAIFDHFMLFEPVSAIYLHERMVYGHYHAYNWRKPTKVSRLVNLYLHHNQSCIGRILTLRWEVSMDYSVDTFIDFALRVFACFFLLVASKNYAQCFTVAVFHLLLRLEQLSIIMMVMNARFRSR